MASGKLAGPELGSAKDLWPALGVVEPGRVWDGPRLSVRLLGGFEVQGYGHAGSVTDWQRRSAKSLIKLLATRREHALHREQVMDLLWPGVDVDSASNSLGKALHAARRAIEPRLLPRQSSAYLRLVDSMLVLDREHVVVDADQFEQVAERALRGTDPAAYESALAAYGGELLPEDRYADWCAERREFLAELRVRLLVGMAGMLEQRGAYNQAADRLREVLQQDMTREEVHRQLMRLYAGMGLPDQALRQFHVCEDILRRELGLGPQEATLALLDDVLASRIHGFGAVSELGAVADREPERVAPPRPSPVPADRGVDLPCVGREDPLEGLCRELMRGGESGIGMVLVSGEAGVGKTRLLEEFAARTAQRGATVLWGGSAAKTAHFAYGPFTIALEGYASSCSPEERLELGRRYPALARVVPSLGPGTTPLSPPAFEPGAHIDFVPAFARLLADLATTQPVLLVVDDLQEVDGFSLDLLRYLTQLAAGRPWLLAGAVREEDLEAGTELQRFIETTTRARLCLKVDLQCLSRRDCDRLVQGGLGAGGASDELLEQIYACSRGNPLFAVELLADLREHGEPPGGGAWTLLSDLAPRAPARVRALAQMRLASLDATARRVLELAAAAGSREISLNELRAGATALDPPVPDPALFDALDRVLQMRVLEERRSCYAFRYPLLRSALYQGLSRHRRDQLQTALQRHPETPRHLVPSTAL